MIDKLIDKKDNFELIRDKIAIILATEIAEQQKLALAAGKNDDFWKLRIFTERFNPWEEYLNPVDGVYNSPLVNVWYDSSSFLEGSSNISERHKSETIYNIDCYGYASSSDNATGGHNPGDRSAAFVLQRSIKLVRNILMSAQYTYLDLRGLVWQRWITSINTFQPAQGTTSLQDVIAARIALRVGFNEFSPQVTPQILEMVSVDVLRSDDGEITVNADYDYTT